MHQDVAFTAIPFAEITKSYRDQNGQMFIEGIASTVDVDLQGERMSPEVIAKMAARLVGKPLREEHQKGYLNKLGEIVQADVVNDDQNRPALWIKARLYDWSTAAKDTFSAIKNGVKLGMSVAGKIKPGGLVKELAESLGKYIPTYKDVEPTEVSITDHPANLNTFALAVSKSFEPEEYNPDEYQKDVTNANESKPKEYSDVPSDKFLDPENYKYPADDKHLMPALRYFNHNGQRTAGGYSADKWATMGRKLARLLSAKTGDSYNYDAEKEQVLQRDKTEKEVNEMNGNLVSKEYKDDVRKFAAEWGSKLPEVKKEAEPKKEEIEKVEEPTAEVKKDAADGDSTASTTSTTTAPKKSTSTVESLLEEIATSLSDLKSSMSSMDSSSTSSAKKAQASTTTTEEKAAASTTSDDSTSLEECMRAMSDSLAQMQGLIAQKAKKTTVPSTTTPSSTDTTTAKTIKDLVEVIAELKKSNEDLKKSYDELPRQRKGYAMTVEKQFTGHTDEKAGYDPDMLEVLKKDEQVGFKELHQYKDYGILPAKYAEKKAA